MGPNSATSVIMHTMKAAADVEMGWLDICLRVNNFEESQTFYVALGFHMVEGDASANWGVFVRGTARIGLFGSEYMENDTFSLNFRGGNISEILQHLDKHIIVPEEPPVVLGQRAGSIKLRDPDGNLVFFDSALGELKSG